MLRQNASHEFNPLSCNLRGEQATNHVSLKVDGKACAHPALTVMSFRGSHSPALYSRLYDANNEKKG